MSSIVPVSTKGWIVIPKKLDCFALALAKRVGGTVVTGGSRVRKSQ